MSQEYFDTKIRITPRYFFTVLEVPNNTDSPQHGPVDGRFTKIVTQDSVLTLLLQKKSRPVYPGTWM